MFDYKILRKWTLITVFCGAHSFVWGVMVDGNIFAMLAGLVTIILGFSYIESHPAYQARRAANALMGRALDIGIRLRVYFTCYLAAWWGLSAVGNFWRFQDPFFFFAALPYMAELWIGFGASWMCKFLTGLSLEPGRGQSIKMGVEENFIATYATTILTGLLHTIILAALCVGVYILLRILTRIRT